LERAEYKSFVEEGTGACWVCVRNEQSLAFMVRPREEGVSGGTGLPQPTTKPRVGNESKVEFDRISISHLLARNLVGMPENYWQEFPGGVLAVNITFPISGHRHDDLPLGGL
jgi:hypothetical protein